MSNKKKWKWIAQDKDGCICKYSTTLPPDLRNKGWYARENQFTIIEMGFADEVNGWKESLINLETHDYEISKGILIKIDKLISIDEICKAFSVPLPLKHAHYKKDVKHLDYIDVYRIIDLYELHDPCFQHALKKILVPGARGHKDLTKDINDIIDTMRRKLEMMAENEKKL